MQGEDRKVVNKADVFAGLGLVQVDGVWVTSDEVRTEAPAKVEIVMPSGCLSDPQGMLSDALGRFEQVPERESTIKRAKSLIKEHQVEDARFRVPSEPDMDVVIVLHPQPKVVKGVDDEDILVDRYMVFGRECAGTVRGNCFTCNNAARKGVKAADHQCWRKRTWDEWVPVLFAWAHGLDDAEDLAKELRSAWQATAEQKYGDNQRDWSAEIEVPFSGDWQAGYMAGRGNAWTTLSS